MSEVVDLGKFKQSKSVGSTPAPSSAENEWHIPDVYRLTGFEYDLARGDNVSFPFVSDRPAPIQYTLYSKKTETVARPMWQLIKRLDPDVDNGCVAIRHHANYDQAYAYSTRELDGLLNVALPTSTMFTTLVGIFTVTHYTRLPRGVPNHLLIHIRSLPGMTAEELVENDIDGSQYMICHPDGTVTWDSSLLYPGYKKW